MACLRAVLTSTEHPTLKFRDLPDIARRRFEALHLQRIAAASADYIGAPAETRPPAGYRFADPDEAAGVLATLPVPERADAAANHAAWIAAVLELRGSPRRAGMISASHQQIADRMAAHGRPVARRCAGNYTQTAIDAGVLMVVHRGTSKLVNRIRNISNVYAVLVPDPEWTEADQQALDALAQRLANESCHHVVPVRDLVLVDGALGRTAGRKSPIRIEHPERFAVRNRSERTRATAALVAMLGLHAYRWSLYGDDIMRRTSDFFRAGWTAEGIAYAALHDPDGTRDSPLTDGDKPLHLLSARLKRWRAGGMFGAPPVAAPVREHELRRGPSPARMSDTPPPAPALPERTGPVSEAARAAVAAVRAALRPTRCALISRYAQ